MRITVGSTNQVKIAAAKEAVLLYPALFPDPKIEGVDVAVDLYGHPKNIEETVAGAMERARQAFADCAYSIGLEGGLIAVPHSISGYMETGACAIYDGKRFYLGLAPSFEWPQQVTQMILRGEADASAAFKHLKLTEHEKLGATEGGIIGMLTDGRVMREEFSKISILMAMIQIEKAELYKIS